jgi:hypothetical protein
MVSSYLDVSPPPHAPPSSSSVRSVLLAPGARAQPSGSPACLLSFPSTRSFPKLLWRLASIPLRAYLPQLPSASCSVPWFQLTLTAELSAAPSFSLPWLRAKFLWPRPPFLFQLAQVCSSSSKVVTGCSGSMAVSLWVRAVLGSLPCASLPLPSACRAWIQPQRRGLLPRREFPCLPWPALGLLLAADARRLAGLLPPPCARYPLLARVPSSAARSSYGARPCFFPQRPAPSCRSPCLLPGSVGTPLWSRLVLCFLYQVRPELSLLGPCPSVCSSSSADHRCSSGAATLCSRHAQSSARGALSRSPMVELLHQTAPVLATNPARPDP